MRCHDNIFSFCFDNKSNIHLENESNCLYKNLHENALLNQLESLKRNRFIVNKPIVECFILPLPKCESFFSLPHRNRFLSSKLTVTFIRREKAVCRQPVLLQH